MPSTGLAAYTLLAATPFSLVRVLDNGEAPIPAEANWWIIATGVYLILRQKKVEQATDG